ncbi:glycosyl hydrolase family 18 protein [Macellibacteroides fermentans]|uniref:glycosyl hydrolase family 18 protein n=1 Tax=Macellibacteroides fermentans TaxID=879969 RepID=UPI002B3757B7|nr:glycosyl hydrolase family 18 protein [Macellibacteroides fermentans]
MTKKMKTSLLLIVAMVMGVIVTSCDNTDENVTEVQEEAQATTRAVGTKTPKLTVYIETNDINPLNAKEYYFCDTIPQKEEVIDHVILFASNIRGTATTVELYHNPNQTHILNNAATLIQPLQAKGIKVMLGLLGDWTGVGFANLNSTLRVDFAQQVANCVTTYGLDGVDFDDEYADYGNAPPGLPAPSATNFGLLIQEVRDLLPDKLITVFHYGGYTNFDATTMSSLDYMWPNFGCAPTPPTGLANSKWAKLSIRIISSSSTIPNALTIQACASSYSGYGAVMMFNLRDWSAASIMNNFASRVWGTGRTVCHTGTTHAKTW